MQGADMLKQVDSNTQLIEMVQDYAVLFKQGEDKQAEYVLNEICALNAKASLNYSGYGNDITDSPDNLQAKTLQTDHGLYCQVGKLTRELHDSINDFVNDSRMQMMTSEDMPDARQRLKHVIELTEQSAHKTMSLIEHSNPLLSTMQKRVSVLQQQLQDSKSNENLNFLSEEIDAFLHLVSSSSKKISSDMNEIMLAQNYQDLTGQVIQKVSTLVQEVEKNLLTLLQLGNKLLTDKTSLNKASGYEQVEVVATNIARGDKAEDDQKQNNLGYGPAVPGVSKGDVLQSQEDVDDLLSSLGF